MGGKTTREQVRRWEQRNLDKVAAKMQRRYAKVRQAREAIVAEKVAELHAAGCLLIKEFPNYLISPRGEVYSTHMRRVIRVRPGVKPGGYEFVGLRGDRVAYVMIHRLVAEAFISNPNSLPFVNHLDGNKRHNNAENLEWCTHFENIRHAIVTGLFKTGSTHPNCKLTASAVKTIREATGHYRDIGRQFGVSAQTVCNVKRRSRYADVA